MWTSKLFLAVSLLGLAILPNRSFAVTNAVVGTCMKGTQFTSIQTAVNNASAGSTVKVCPGTSYTQFCADDVFPAGTLYPITIPSAPSASG